MGVAYFAAALVGPLMLFAVFFLSVAVGMSEVDVPGVVDGGLIWAGVGVLAVFLIVYFFADLTTWSLHPFYKRRLSSVFALRRVVAEAALDPRSKRSTGLRWCPHPTRERRRHRGRARLRQDAGALSDMAMGGGEGEEWPTLLICAAANISDTGATPPGRRVTSFTFSAHAVGGPLVGAVPPRRSRAPSKSRRRTSRDRPSGAAAISPCWPRSRCQGRRSRPRWGR